MPRSWQTLEIEDMTSKSRMELLRAELASLGKTLTTVQEHSILDHCDECNCSPIYVVLLANDIARYARLVKLLLLEYIVLCAEVLRLVIVVSR